MTTTLDGIRNLIAKKQNLLGFALQANHDLTTALNTERETLKRIEDQIVQEIWSSDKYKNDRDRNAAKHLARINDERYFNQQASITKLEAAKAENQGAIMTFQADIDLLKLDYEMLLLGRRDSLHRFSVMLARMAQADTSTAIEARMGGHFVPGSALAVGGAVTGNGDGQPVAAIDLAQAADATAPVDTSTAQPGEQALPNCNTCGQPMAIADAGIRKGKTVHGVGNIQALHCPANAGTMMNPAHPDFFNAVGNAGLVNSLAFHSENRRDLVQPETPIEKESKGHVLATGETAGRKPAEKINGITI